MSSRLSIPRMRVSDLLGTPTEEDMKYIGYLRCLGCNTKNWDLVCIGPNDEVVVCNYCNWIDDCLLVH
jgi:hypothetical protein